MRFRPLLPSALMLALAACAQSPAPKTDTIPRQDSRGPSTSPEEASAPTRAQQVVQRYEAALEQANEGEFDAALTSLGAALELDPDYGPAHFERGVLLEVMELHEDALEAYDEVLRLDPNFDDLHYNRGVCFTSMGSWPEALEAYDQAIAADPDFGWAHTNRAETLIQLRRFPEARLAAKTAIQLDDSDTLAYQLLGVAHLNGGDPQAAYDAFQVCLERDPGNSSHLYNSGLALEDLGRPNDALMSHMQAFVANPDHSGARAAARRLREQMMKEPKTGGEEK